MSELWLFVYIESHVILHAKADAQKVNCLLERNLSLEKVMKVVSSEVTSLFQSTSLDSQNRKTGSGKV